MAVKNREAFDEIKRILGSLDEKDKVVHDIILELLNWVYLEYNSGSKQSIEKKLYDKIDAEIKFQIKQS